MKHLLTFAVFIIALTATAQTRKVFDLGTDMGLSFMQSKLQVKHLVADSNAAKVRYKQFWERRKIEGKTAAQFMELSAFDAAYGEAAWQGQGGATTAPVGILNSNNHIYIPSGEYWCTITALLRGMQVYGEGGGYVGTDGKNSVNTKLVVWHEKWQDDPNERHLMQTDTWNKGKGNNLYSEGLEVKGIAFEGRQNEFPSQSFNSSGLRLWYPGEVTTIDHLYPRNFRTAGIECFGSTPLNAGVVSVFDNVVAGVIFYGSGSTVNWDLLTGDDNGYLFMCKHGYNDTGGGTINFGAIKSETCVATAGRVHRGASVGWIEGQATVNVGALSAYAGGCYVDAVFIMDTRSPYYPPQNASLNVGGVKVKGYKNMVMQLAGSPNGLTAHYWSTRGDYTTDGFSWSSYGGGSFQWNVSTIPANKVAHSCTGPVPYSKTGYPTGCGTYRYIIDGPPRNLTTVYLDQATTPPVPPDPVPVPCTYTYGPWTACTLGVQTRTATASPSGCVGTVPQDSLTRSCTVTPPPSSFSGYDPNDVLVVSNTADPRSAAWAASYAAAWGIPSGNVISVNAGTSHDASGTVVGNIRSAVNAKAEQVTVLAWEYPSRSGSQSITSAVMYGVRDVFALTTSALYNYSGTKPRTDKGVAACFLLVSDKYIRRDAHGTNPTGQSILLLAKDQSGTPRGSARASQTATGVAVWDNRTLSSVGSGNNACNYISNSCWVASRKPGSTPIVAAYQSMYQLGTDGATWAKGFYGDHVTSFGGWLPALASGLNSQGQTPLTYHLDRGASLSVGSVSEPWQGSNGSLAQQFVDVSIFHPLFITGKPVGAAAYAAVRSADRMLFAGDPLTAIFAKP